VFGDGDLLERRAGALEQAAHGNEKSDRDGGRQRGGGDRRDDAGAGWCGLGFDGSLLAVLFRSDRVRRCGTYFPPGERLQSFSAA
jgi:hypothetical protein